MFRIIVVGFFFHSTNNHARREKFGVKSFGEADALSVFAGHWEAKNIDTASAEPLFDCCEFFFHVLIISYHQYWHY